MPLVKEIFVDVTSCNAWTNRTPRRIGRTGVDGSILISSPIHSGMSKSSTPDYSDSSRTIISIGTSDTTSEPPCDPNVISKIGDIRQSATPDLRDSNKLYTYVDGKFTNNLVAPLIFTDVLGDKLFNSSSRDIYARVGMHLESDPINYDTSQFVD